MVRRAGASVFVGGAYVFPGGALDAVDRSETARRLFGAGEDSPWISAGVRETAEEAGVAVPTGSVDVPRTLRGGTLLEALANAGYRFDADRFAYLSNWLTPKGPPRRFDTRFFVTDAPPTTEAFPDTEEVTEATWVSPRAALDWGRTGQWTLVPPTVATLQLLDAFDCPAAVLAFARGQKSVPRIEPRLVRRGGTLEVLMPGDAGYEDAE